jgi:hypothetical protein
MRPSTTIVIAALAAAIGPCNARPVAACDVCAVYTATELRERRTGFRLGVAEQITGFSMLQRDSEEVPNTAGERMTSSITQIVAGYGITPRLGVQVNLPIIVRKFRRVEAGRLVSATRADRRPVAVGHALVYSSVSEESVFRFSVLGGVKFPTGIPTAWRKSSTRCPRPASRLRARSVRVTLLRPAIHLPRRTAGASRERHPRPRPRARSDPSTASSAASSSGAGNVSSRPLAASTRSDPRAPSYEYANDLTWTVGRARSQSRARVLARSPGALHGRDEGNDQQAGVKLDDLPSPRSTSGRA